MFSVATELREPAKRAERARSNGSEPLERSKPWGHWIRLVFAISCVKAGNALTQFGRRMGHDRKAGTECAPNEKRCATEQSSKASDNSADIDMLASAEADELRRERRRQREERAWDIRVD